MRRQTTDSPTRRRSRSGRWLRRSVSDETGNALLETALTLPLLLLVSISIFEFGRAYQTWQVLTNAAREGARVAVLPGSDATAVTARVTQYMNDGQLGNVANARVALDTTQTISIGGTATAPASQVTVTYPFDFMVLNPVAQLLVRGSTMGSSFTMTVAAKMRNE
jgi:Flp pilus assembly protein TadG